MNPGSPMLEIDEDIIAGYRRNGHNWRAIAAMCGCSTQALRAWRRRHNYVDLYEQFDDVEVDNVIRNFVDGQPNIGKAIIIAHVQGVHNIHGTREELRASTRRVDPDGLELRRQ